MQEDDYILAPDEIQAGDEADETGPTRWSAKFLLKDEGTSAASKYNEVWPTPNESYSSEEKACAVADRGLHGYLKRGCFLSPGVILLP